MITSHAMVPAPWRINSRGMRAVFLQNRFTHRPHPENVGWWFYLIFFLFFFSIRGSFPCYLLHFETKIFDWRPICCILNPWFACYLLHFGAKIFNLHAICCVFGLQSLMYFGAEVANLGRQNRTFARKLQHFPRVFNNVWMVFIDFLIVFSDLSMVSKVP